MSKMIRAAGIVNDSITDGPGIRLALFVQGCPRRCEGCHNPETHDFNGGYDISVEEILEKIKKNPILSGITLSGGEPFCQAQALVPLAKSAKALGLEVATYTGYLFESLVENEDEYVRELVRLSDVIVDGEFIRAKRNLDIKFRGSENQRIIDVKRSLESGHVVVDESDRWN